MEKCVQVNQYKKGLSVKHVMWVDTQYEEKLYINAEYVGRVDTLTVEELLDLLAKKDVIFLRKRWQDS